MNAFKNSKQANKKWFIFFEKDVILSHNKKWAISKIFFENVFILDGWE